MNATPQLFLSETQQRLVRESFASLREYSNSVIVLFYGRLFETAPQVRGLFHIGVEQQAQKLLDMLSVLVEAMDQFENLRPRLLELGRKHAGYGVVPAHYPMLRSALLWAFGTALELEFDRSTRDAWERLLEATSAVMLEGAQTA